MHKRISTTTVTTKKYYAIIAILQAGFKTQETQENNNKINKSGR